MMLDEALDWMWRLRDAGAVQGGDGSVSYRVVTEDGQAFQVWAFLGDDWGDYLDAFWTAAQCQKAIQEAANDQTRESVAE